MSNVVSLMIGAVVGFVYAAILASVTMNATERARRSDSLYYDTQVTNRRALCDMIANLESVLAESKAENAKLREQMERLVTLLRVDCDIDASWDGLRRFWSIGLTEDGCLMRDRACKAEAENAKLRELVDILCFCMQIHKRCDDCKLNGAKGELGHDPLLACDGLHEMLKELGIEVE